MARFGAAPRVHNNDDIIMNPISYMWARLRSVYESRHEPERLRPLTILYWRMVLVAALIGGVLILSIGSWVFFTVVTVLSDTDAGVSAPTPNLDRAQLEAFLRIYDERAALYETARQ